MLVDYHVHVLAHGEYEYTEERIRQFLDQARRQGITEIGLAEHEEWGRRIRPEVLEVVRMNASGICVRQGMEIDYNFEREGEIRGIIKKWDLDFVIGSVHFIDGWGFDRPDSRSGFDGADIDELYERYFRLVAQAVRSGLFDVIGHLDLIKIWGHRPARKRDLEYVEPFLLQMKRSGVVVEINTAGLRKPVNEMYPSPSLLKALFEADIPITFGSDAHEPGDVGRDLAKARELARQAGYRWCVGFDRRQRYEVTITD
ncbi:histidinol-phosphatase [Syntrophothermus lipocalidus]|uniref:Histidinol-phosphatase n=1 Tax=Syntrophothermus lipocalidus (strain DSM 12680 / TGB-C1) TaxID=643648 RepID=D7CNQ8_SYNLT|nr:histidinol-phosphatase [Syntrophothermus lipocalidus]ADI02343.1 histidinol phosphate phosphatase HisJ family [Syntrophothermus lipocalidus DSM 12680]